jgi:hypothetical protein
MSAWRPDVNPGPTERKSSAASGSVGVADEHGSRSARAASASLLRESYGYEERSPRISVRSAGACHGFFDGDVGAAISTMADGGDILYPLSVRPRACRKDTRSARSLLAPTRNTRSSTVARVNDDSKDLSAR